MRRKEADHCAKLCHSVRENRFIFKHFPNVFNANKNPNLFAVG